MTSAFVTPAYISPVYIYGAVRTPFGKLGGGLAEVRPDDLAATALTGLLAQTPELDPAAVGEVVWGNANGAGEENRNVGRMAVLLAGLPLSGAGDSTVNRLCGSSLDAAMMGSRTIETGDADVVRRRRGRVDDPGALGAAEAGPGLPGRRPGGGLDHAGLAAGQPRPCRREWTVSLGEANEQLQEKFGISRERQDAFAARSHRLADRGLDERLLRRPGGRGARAPSWTRDESIRPGSTLDKLATLKPAFRPEGTITAGNASPAQRRRLRGAARVAARRPTRIGTVPAGPDRRPGRQRAGAADVRLRAGRGGEPGAAPGR